MSYLPWLAAAAGLCTAIIAAWTDHRTGRIPNRLTVPGLVAGLGLGLASGQITGLLLAAAGALVTALVPLVLFRMNAMGGGDVKLFAALGALVGAEVALQIQMLAFTLGALWGLGIWLRQGLLRQGLCSVAGLALGPLGKGLRSSAGAVAARAATLRFGPAVLVATAAVIADRFLLR